MKLGGVVLITVLLVACCWVQGVWLSQLAVRGEWPDLCLVAVVLLPLFYGGEAGLIAGVVSGLAMGFAVGTAMPAFFASRVLTGVAADGLRQRFHSDNLIVQAAAVTAGTLLAEVVFAVFAPAVLGPDWAARVLLRAGLNGLAAPPLAVLLRRLPLRPEQESG